MLQPKDIDWLNGYKSKACINAIYNRPTSALEDTSRLKVRGWKKVFYANENQKKVEKQSILIDKIDCYERKMDNT